MTISRHPVRVVVPSVGATLAVTDVTVSLDESWSPYCRVDITAPIPPDEVMDALDPREGRRIKITMAQEFGDPVQVAELTAAHGGDVSDWTAAYGGDALSVITAAFTTAYNATGLRSAVSRTFDVGIRSRDRDPTNGTVRITAASDEALLQDYAWHAEVATTPTVQTVRGAVELAISEVPNLGTPSLEPGAGDVSITADSAAWTPGVTAWDYVRPLVDSAGLRLWCDETRAWHLTDPLVGAEGSLTLDGASTVTAASDIITRDGADGAWWDSVVVIYEWTDSGNVRHKTYDVAGAGSRTLTVRYDRPYPGPGAAGALLARTRGRGHVMSVDAVNDYRATPGQALSLTVPGVPTQYGMVSAVEFRSPDDEMRIRTRDLSNVTLTAWSELAVGIAWQDAPVGVSWEDPDPDPAEIGA